MTDNDYNIIKPVESLHNIAGLTPVKDREERRRRQSRTNRPSRRGGKDPDLDEDENTTPGSISAARPIDGSEERESTEGGLNESVDPETHTGKSNDDENDRHSIDYCA